MSAVRIAEIDVGVASNGCVVQILMTMDGVPSRPQQWRDVAVALARTLQPQGYPVDGVYAVFDSSSAASAVLEFGRVLELEDADGDALRQLGAGATVAYAAVRRGKGGPKNGEKEPVVAVTIQTAPQEPGGVFGRRRTRRGCGCVIAAVGDDGEVRHLEHSRRPGGVGADAADLAAAYSR